VNWASNAGWDLDKQTLRQTGVQAVQTPNRKRGNWCPARRGVGEPGLEATWLRNCRYGALWGVGPATAAKLEKLGLQWVRDLALVDERTLASHVGPSLAATLWAFAHGEDNREVVVDRVVKSIGHEQTFLKSLQGIDEISDAARSHSGRGGQALRNQGRVARTIPSWCALMTSPG